MPEITFTQPAAEFGAATVRRWIKETGQTFEAGDALVELESEGALIVVEASVAGRLTAILAEQGRTVPVGAALAQIDAIEATHVNATTAPLADKKMDTAGHNNRGKVIPILMPQAGNTMEEGTVVAWRVAEGDAIAAGQIICEIETDKATMEFESPDAGRLAKIVAVIGEPIAVKRPIALLADNNADADAFLAGTETSTTVPQVAAKDATASDRAVQQPIGELTRIAARSGGRVKASPAARRFAGERGVDLSSLGAGSGPNGRILSTDFDKVRMGDRAQGTAAETRKPLSKMRRAIGLNLQQSKQTVPHFYVRSTIDAERMLEFYRGHKSVAACTLNDVIVLAVARAIRDFSAMRSRIVDNEIVESRQVNIGLAVGIDGGLVVPVVTSVDTLSLAELAAATKQAIENARRGKLDNIGKGHFTISNLGMFGVDEFSAIINPPESGILAVGAVREAIVVENGAMRAGRVMTLTLSADHRIVDGVMAAKFMARLRHILENPASELI